MILRSLGPALALVATLGAAPAALGATPAATSRASAPAADALVRDGFEQAGLARWTVVTRGRATVRVDRAAALAGARGVRVVARDRGAHASLARALPETTAISVSLRTRVTRGGPLLTLTMGGGRLLTVTRDAGGHARLCVAATCLRSRATLPRDRSLRLVLKADMATGRAALLRGATRLVAGALPLDGQFVRLGMGGRGPFELAIDDLAVLALPAATDPAPGPDPVPDPSPDPDPTPPPPARYRFEGVGSDHGVGMSQWGAKGRAEAGQDAATILAHYYPGTTLGARGNVPVRVLLVDKAVLAAGAVTRVCGRDGTWTVTGSAVVAAGTILPADACAVLGPDADGAWTLRITGPGGGTVTQGPWDGDSRFQPLDPATRLTVPLRSSTYQRYRGTVRMLLRPAGLSAVNELPLEDYLLGVVPAELSAASPREALRAQAIAARSYAFTHRRPSNTLFDLYPDARNQAYLGVNVERPASSAAVTDTAGQVVLYGTAVANTLYHSIGGGATEDARNVFTSADGALGSDIPYLRGSLDVDENGTPYDQACSCRSWATRTFTLAELGRILAKDARTDVGTLTALNLKRRGISGRLISVTITGSERTVKVAGWLFESVFNANRGSGSPLVSTAFWLRPAG